MPMRRPTDVKSPNVQPNSAEAGGGVLEEIERSEDLPAMISAAEACTAVMCGLEQTLGDEAAQRLERDLPAGVRKLVSRCGAHAEEVPKRPESLDEFLKGVGEHLEVDDADARAITHTVFHAVHRLMSVGEVQEVARELPLDMRALWTAGDDRGEPIQGSRGD
jgi:uncharacterized protein (DUF2267 family)